MTVAEIADSAMTVVDHLEERGFDPQETGPDSWKSRCPVHRGDGHSLSITRADDGKVLLKCFAHDCGAEKITDALGLRLSDLFPANPHPGVKAPDRKAKAREKSRKGGKTYPTPEAAIKGFARTLGIPAAHWDYHDVEGGPFMRVYRFNNPPTGERKTYRPVHRTSGGLWMLGDPPGLLPLYRLPELAGANRVYVTEGEKAADALRNLGLVVTTSSHGCKGASKTDWMPLSGKDEIIILPDHNGAGENYANAVRDALAKVDPQPTRVKTVRLPDIWKIGGAEIPNGGDIVDWFEVGVPEGWTELQCKWEIERAAGDALALPLPQADKGEKPHKFKLTCMADVETKPVEWLWSGRVPLGMLTLWAGDPKLGKSFVTVDIAAAVSRGAPLPHDPSADYGGPGSVILLSAEDDPARTIKPRLESAGADMRKVFILESVRLDDGTDALPNLMRDMENLEDAIEQVGDCRLVIIDPISAYLGGADEHRNAELRGLLSPVKALAERRNLAVVVVTHLNKGTATTNPKYRVTGSIAFVAACRSNFLFTKDPDDSTGHRVLMLDNGCNLASNPPTLAFSIGDRGGDGPVVNWEDEPVPITADELSRRSANRSGGGSDAPDECGEWLRKTLSDGPVPQTEVMAQGKRIGYGYDQLNRARNRIGAVSNKDGYGKGAGHLWELPKSRQ